MINGISPKIVDMRTPGEITIKTEKVKKIDDDCKMPYEVTRMNVIETKKDGTEIFRGGFTLDGEGQKNLDNLNEIIASIYYKDNPLYERAKKDECKHCVGSCDEDGVPMVGRHDW